MSGIEGSKVDSGAAKRKHLAHLDCMTGSSTSSASSGTSALARTTMTKPNRLKQIEACNNGHQATVEIFPSRILVLQRA